MSVGFTQHLEILSKIKDIDERLFYIRQCANNFWTVDALKYHIGEDLYHKEGTIKQTNFTRTISDDNFKRKALRSFKDEYLLNFINIEDPEDVDERVIEQSKNYLPLSALQHKKLTFIDNTVEKYVKFKTFCRKKFDCIKLFPNFVT